MTQYQADQVGNACALGDKRLTDWERDFVCSLMDSQRLADVSKLSEKQITILARIHSKVSDVLGV